MKNLAIAAAVVSGLTLAAGAGAQQPKEWSQWSRPKRS